MNGTINIKLQQHISDLKSHLQAEYKEVYVIQYHKMDEISFM